ncbi:serine-type D-Ala-D-Ala carboxypeptidase [Vibrio palustris]|uniref:D-alanyl-D-alanine carboxypeptidase DacB n=1 Tax=Vibrio palustris TaxID=1918946 RepID=A0A1R4B8U5_9VIBR|nr:serine-type D-Ala-D-Ala carboxypeptidase [Vibrio palustris]SJL85332.1 D-alanyl-D-alanine carboxypeptidase DacB precursor [Vibrio palustris]
MRLILLSLAFSSLFLSLQAQAQQDFKTQVSTLSPYVRYHFEAQALDSNETTFKHANGDYFPPASTLKVITALAATIKLGDDFRFATRLRQSNTNYSIQFSGDPSLKTRDLKTLLLKLKQRGVTHIRGDLWLDDSAFDGFEKATGWPWNAIGVCYSAPSSAINLDHNCVPASIYSRKKGNTRIYVPEQYPIHVENKSITVTKQQQETQHCELDLQARHENRYVISGCLLQRKQPLPLKFAIQDTKKYTQRMIYRILNQLKMTIDGRVRIGKPSQRGQTHTIAIHYSKPLPQLLSKMLKKSDNLYADSLTKTLGRVSFHQAGSYRNGTAAIKQIIESTTGVSLKQAKLVDGSGLSRDNRIAASTMLSILQYIYKHDAQLQLIGLLPRSGVSGTLKYRRSLMRSPIKGALAAKSGTLYGTHNLIGFVYNAAGVPTSTFVQYITDNFPSQAQRDARPAPLTVVEQRFYRQLIEQARLTQ